MMLKVNGQYLDFDGDIEIEKKIKLFEDISTTDGDLSFAFDLQLTSNNLSILEIPVPDSITKTVYEFNECIVQNDAGITINNGSLRIERVFGYIASCSFLGGNSNWFAMLDGDMTELRLTQYDRDQTESEIIASWSDTDGIIFPFLDLGPLVTRGYNNVKTEDFTGCFYLKTLFKETFAQSGIKIQGDLLHDSLYNQMIVASNAKSVIDKENNGFSVGTDITQATTYPAYTDVTFELITGENFYIGDSIDFTGGKDFTVNANMIVDIIVTYTPVPVYYATDLFGMVEVNGFPKYSTFGNTTFKNKLLNAGDVLSLVVRSQTSVSLTSARLTIIPKVIYKAFGSSCVPLWTKQKFVSNVLKMFNVITSYNQFTKTLTLDLFDKIKTKPSIDISEFVTVDTIDYSEFISNYGKVNNFTYSEGSGEDLRDYDITSFVKYGAGVINADNQYVTESEDPIELDFTSPISYYNSKFTCSMERINFIELIEDGDIDITSVSDSSGVPRFAVAAGTFFVVGDLVRIETDVDEYNGDFVVTVASGSYIEVRGLVYVSSATGTMIKLTYDSANSEEVFLFIQIPSRPTTDIFNNSGNYINASLETSWPLAFFNILSLGRDFETEYKQGLSFGPVSNPSSYQKTLIDKYWQQFETILNDPVKLFCSGYLPWKVYDSIDFLRPISIRTKETSNLYYGNRITGYKDSSQVCEIELIKLP